MGTQVDHVSSWKSVAAFIEKLSPNHQSRPSLKLWGTCLPAAVGIWPSGAVFQVGSASRDSVGGGDLILFWTGQKPPHQVRLPNCLIGHWPYIPKRPWASITQEMVSHWVPSIFCPPPPGMYVCMICINVHKQIIYIYVYLLCSLSYEPWSKHGSHGVASSHHHSHGIPLDSHGISALMGGWISWPPTYGV